jgi:hypothetical protein
MEEQHREAPSPRQAAERAADDDAAQKRAFAKAMADIHRRAKEEAGYNATLFARMLADHGPLETARRLINTSRPSDGFTHLWERHRLDLTVEAHVLKPEFAALFTDDERDRCRARLAEYGYRLP